MSDKQEVAVTEEYGNRLVVVRESSSNEVTVVQRDIHNLADETTRRATVLAHAVTLHSAGYDASTAEDVLATASKFDAFVTG